LRTAAILLAQLRGAFTRDCRAAEQVLRAGRQAEAATRVADLLRLAPVGRHLVVPWRVVVAGAPNVGKSSLVNALAGFQRCVVTPMPGTTRDAVTTLIAVDGWPVELIDTAGIRNVADDLESAGVDRARRTAADADV